MVNIVFDYRFDATGFFNSPETRRILEEAAAIYSSYLNDNFDAIPAGTSFEITNPSDIDSTEIVTISATVDDIVIFAGADDLGGYRTEGGQTLLTAGQGGSGGYSAAGDVYRSRLGPEFRGEEVTDFEPFAGWLTFNTNPDAAYSFDLSGPVDGFIDALSVALHEIGHVLGIGASATFDNLVGELGFEGPNSLVLNGGEPIPLDEGASHIEDGFNSNQTLMDPLNELGQRRTISEFDLAILADIGYEIDGFEKVGSTAPITTAGDDIPVFGTVVGDIIDGLAGNDQLQGDAGDDLLIGGPGLDILFGGTGNDILNGGQDDDQLQGNAGDDLLDGGAGDDTLIGGAGYDRYVFLGDWGSDFVVDADPDGQLVFSGYEAADLTFTPSGDSLIIAAGSNQVIFIDYFANGSAYDFAYSTGDDTVREGLDTTASLADGVWQSGTIDAEPIAGDGVTSDLVGGFVDKDWYRVTLEPDRLYSFEANALSLTTGLVFLRLYDSFGASVDWTAQGEGSSPSFVYNTDGQSGSESFYIAVSAGDVNNSDFRTATGDFEIRFADVGGDILDVVREGTDTVAMLAVGATEAGRIDEIGVYGSNPTIDKDWFRTTLEAGHTYRFSGTADVDAGDALDEIAISLYRDNNLLVREFVEGGTPSFDYAVAAGSGGTYFLSVSAGGTGDWEDKTGDFEVSLVDLGDTPQATLPQPSYQVIGPAWTDENASNPVFTVVRDGVFEAETIYARLLSGEQNGLDENNGDFLAPATHVPLEFAFGQDQATIEIELINDTLAEEAEEFALVVQRVADDPSSVLASRRWIIQDDDQSIPSDGQDLSRPLILELANVALAAYEELDEISLPGAAVEAGWTTVTIPNTDTWISETNTAGLLQSNLHFYEALIDGVRTLVLAFSGTQPGSSALSFTDFITQIGRWDDLYEAHKPAIEAVLGWAESEVADGVLPFGNLIATGHSLGGILVEELFSDPEFQSHRLVAEATGVTFGSPGSPKIAQTSRIVNFVTLGDPVPMLHSEDFFGLTPEAESKAEFAISAIATPLNFLDGVPTTVPDGNDSTALEVATSIAENIVALPAREGVSITMLRTADNFLGSGESPYYPLHPLHPLQNNAAVGAINYGSYHLLDGDVGYLNSIEQLANYYGSANRGGQEDLDFWLSNGSGWHFLRDPDILDMSVAFAQGLGFGALNLALDNVRLVVGLVNAGVNILQSLGNATVTALEFGVDGVASAWGTVRDFFSGTAEALDTTLENAGDRVEIFFRQLGFGEEEAEFSEGSAIISIDTVSVVRDFGTDGCLI